MRTEIVTNQILSLVKNYCKPNVVTGLMKDLRRSEALERSMMKVKSAGRTRKQGWAISLSDQDKLDRLITLCHDRLAVDEVCQVLLGIGDIFKVHGETNRAEEMYTMALTQGEQSGKKGYVAEAYMRRGEIYSRKAQWKQSTADLGRSRVIFSELKHHEALGRVENILGTNHAEQGKVKQAVEFFERALTLFERTRRTHMAGVALMNLGITCNIIGDYDSALAHYKRAQSCFEEVGDLNRLGELHHNMGMSYLSKRLFNEAIREFNTSHMLSSSVQNVSLMGLASLAKANAYYHLHDLPMALTLVNQAIELFTKSNERLSLADSYKVKGMIHREMKSLDTAASYLQTSLRINIEINNQLNIAESYFEIGLLELKRKRKDEAITAFQTARVAFKKVGAEEEVKKTQHVMDSIKG
ncbi:MAG: tetratricopeptide repeat protein [Bacteroidota bacterium]